MTNPLPHRLMSGQCSRVCWGAQNLDSNFCPSGDLNPQPLTGHS